MGPRAARSGDRPTDLIKSPVVLDCLDLPDREVLHESDIESAILGKLSILSRNAGRLFVGLLRRALGAGGTSD